MTVDELPREQLDVIHELVLRGLQTVPPHEREYGEAYDAFVEAADYPMRIGDQPERVQDVWNKIIEADPADARAVDVEWPELGAVRERLDNNES